MLQYVGSQRVRHNLVNTTGQQQQQAKTVCDACSDGAANLAGQARTAGEI